MTDFKFTHPIEVRYGDLDPQGHLNNAKYLTYFEQARIHYFIHLGLRKPDISFLDIGVILADVHITYKESVVFGMDIVVGVSITRLGNRSFDVAQALIDRTRNKLMASAELVLVCFDYHTSQTTPIPPLWRETLSRFEDLRSGEN